MKTPQQIVDDFITQYEGGLSLRDDDKGNYITLANGQKLKVGSKYGVTGAALAAHRKIPTETVTPGMIADLSKDEAVQIGYEQYYLGYHLNLLQWNHVSAAMLDFVWASGSWGVRVLQRMLKQHEDGIIGKKTATDLMVEIAQFGEEYAANRLADYRIGFIRGVRGWATFHHGWENRITSFRPGTPWWSEFEK